MRQSCVNHASKPEFYKTLENYKNPRNSRYNKEFEGFKSYAELYKILSKRRVQALLPLIYQYLTALCALTMRQITNPQVVPGGSS
jgi:hypothetical protein